MVEFTGEFYVPEEHGNVELEHVHRYLLATQIVTGKAVLDIACGEGYGSSLLASEAETVVGVDISEALIEHANARYGRSGVSFSVGDCAAVPLPDGSVDVVVSFETLEHHDRHEAMMREMKRVLRPNGTLLMSTPDRLRYSVEPGTTNPFHVKELYEAEFKALIHRHFRHATFLGQRIAYGSVVLSDDGSMPSMCYWREPSPSLRIVSGNNRPVYWLALASDASLPLLRVGAFEQPIDEAETVVAWRHATATADRRAFDLERSNSDLRTELGDAQRAASSAAIAQQKLESLEQTRLLLTAQSAELRDAALRARAVAEHRQALLDDLARAKSGVERDLHEARSLANRLRRALDAQLRELFRLREQESRFIALSYSRLFRFRDALREQPLSVHKLARVGKRGLALVIPRRGRPQALLSVPALSPSDVPDGFDPVYYLLTYPDVAGAGWDPLQHYLLHGRAEGRRPHEPHAVDGDVRLPPLVVDTDGRTYRPLVSVIVPAYNHAPFLEERLCSIYSQSYQGPVEVFLLDDASTDGSSDILREYANRHRDRTTLVVNAANSGSAFRQWERGFRLAKGDLVWIAESDDLCDLDFLATLVPLMANPAVMAAFGTTLFFHDTPGNVVWTLSEYLHEHPSLRFDSAWIRSARDLVTSGFYDKNIIPNVSAAVLRHPGRLAVLDDPAWQGMRLAGDWLFYVELTKCGLIAFTPDAIGYHRVSETTLTTQVAKTRRLATEIAVVRAAMDRVYRHPAGATPTGRFRARPKEAGGRGQGA